MLHQSESDLVLLSYRSASQIKTQSFLYPARLILPESKSRLVFFENRSQRKQAILAVLAAQGYKNQLEQYNLLDTIGEGSCNPVFVAEHKSTGLKVAIKVMDLDKSYRSQHENGISEGCAMELCQKSSNVATLVETFTVENRHYVVTKFYKTGDLLSYLESKEVNCLPEAETRDLIKQVATGVKDIHAQGLAHRDLKHLNILISITEGLPNARITDFGMAARLKKGQTISKIAGTIGFMAPEVVLNSASDFKADVWSLGVMLFALISSQVPFCGKNRDETANMIVNDVLRFKDPVWLTVSEDCKDLLRLMLTKDQSRRIPIEEVLEHPWFARTV